MLNNTTVVNTVKLIKGLALDVGDGAGEAPSGVTAELVESWSEYLRGFANWKSFLTLTFRAADRTHEVTGDQAERAFSWLIQRLNSDLFGKHYTRIVHHSYFAYALALERHKSGLLHMHALVDRRINFQLAIALWQKAYGYIKIEPVYDDGVIAYVCKYITKGGDIKVYCPKVYKMPAFVPMWFMEDTNGH
jgi:hypothetical protein